MFGLSDTYLLHDNIIILFLKEISMMKCEGVYIRRSLDVLEIILGTIEVWVSLCRGYVRRL